jgi:hypothetical protein
MKLAFNPVGFRRGIKGSTGIQDNQRVMLNMYEGAQKAQAEKFSAKIEQVRSRIAGRSS